MFAETMKAVVTTGDGKFELREVPVPQPRPTEILIKVEACAQNHTDCEPFLTSTLFAFSHLQTRREVYHLTQGSG